MLMDMGQENRILGPLVLKKVKCKCRCAFLSFRFGIIIKDGKGLFYQNYQNRGTLNYVF